MLFNPTFYRKNISYLNADELKKESINVLLLDVDNTLRKHHAIKPEEFVDGFIKNMQDAGIKLIITSNAKKSHVKSFADSLGIDYFSLCKKPLPFKLKKALDVNGIDKKNVALVGDQLFTDILCCKLLGIKSVLVTPIELENIWNFKIRRFFESLFLERIKKHGYK